MSEETKTQEFTRVKVDKHGRSMYRANGNKNTTIRFGASFFTGEPPTSITLSAPNIATQLTKDQRKAAVAAVPKEVAKAARKAAKEARDAVIAAALKAAPASDAPAVE